jgi:peptidoglycan/LPS O-acetylase OafA/YrhL
MIFLLGIVLSCTAWYWLNYKIRHKQGRQCVGLLLVFGGATATYTLDAHLDQFFIWGFAVAWCIGLNLFFDADKYRDEY